MGFLGSWTPYGMVSLWSVCRDGRSIPPLVSMLPCLFAKTSTVYNPLIYYAFSTTFKAQVKQLCCLCGRTNACHPGAEDDKAMENTIYLVCDDTKPPQPPQPRPCMDGMDLRMEGQMETQLTQDYQ